jgi:hypothetical protein
MGSGFVEARYEWNWSSLVGGVQGVLRACELPHDAAWVSAALGDAFRVGARGAMESRDGEGMTFARTGYQRRPLDSLTAELAVLGLRAEVMTRALPDEGLPRFLRRRIRRRIDRGEAVVAYGVGAVHAARSEFGLIVGYDDGREAYRIDGPLTAETGAWLPYDVWQAEREEGAAQGARWFAVIFAVGRTAMPEAVPSLARRQVLASDSVADLGRWGEMLEGGTPVHPQGHAFWVQSLVAARYEASRFWSVVAADDARLAAVAALYQRETLALSRLATLYPYPSGGDAPNAGLRRLAGGMLREAAAVEREVVDRLRGLAIEAPGASGA